MSQGVKEISSEKAAGVKGGQKGGKVEVRKALSAPAIGKMLSGICFPVNKTELVEFAHKKDKSKVVENTNDELFDILNKLPAKTYYKITDIEIEIGKLR